MANRSEADSQAAAGGDDFAWRAFCYLHGELSPEEAEAFEEDLAVEQSARDELAAAVQLSMGLHAAGDQLALPAEVTCQRRPMRRFSRTQVVWAVGIAACLLLGIAAVWNLV